MRCTADGGSWENQSDFLVGWIESLPLKAGMQVVLLGRLFKQLVPTLVGSSTVAGPG
jgi:hypothetical protein